MHRSKIGLLGEIEALRLSIFNCSLSTLFDPLIVLCRTFVFNSGCGASLIDFAFVTIPDLVVALLLVRHYSSVMLFFAHSRLSQFFRDL